MLVDSDGRVRRFANNPVHAGNKLNKKDNKKEAGKRWIIVLTLGVRVLERDMVMVVGSKVVKDGWGAFVVCPKIGRDFHAGCVPATFGADYSYIDANIIVLRKQNVSALR